MRVSAIPCPACGAGELERFLDLPAVPALSTVFHPSAASARAAPRGDLCLALCRSCGLVWNEAFDAGLVDYAPDYENSQHFSPAFQVYAKELATHLADTYLLEGRDVVEIGSGKGEFLAELCAASGCRGIGFDPTFDGEVCEGATGVQIVRHYYDGLSTQLLDLDPELVIARHVLEHLPDPSGFLASLRETGGAGAALYLEVPNAEFVFGHLGMWDLIYQHVAYFGAASLESLVRRSGYSVTDLRTSFHGQFLAVEAVPGPGSGYLGPDPRAVAAACEHVDTFAHRLRSRLDHWRARLADERSGEVVLWGAGAKGVAFLNLLGPGPTVDRVVDVNPRKVGRHVPGTGHLVESPSSLRGGNVDLVLVLNRAYESEIRDEIHRLGFDAPLAMV